MVWIFGVAVMAALASLGVSPAPAGAGGTHTGGGPPMRLARPGLMTTALLSGTASQAATHEEQRPLPPGGYAVNVRDFGAKGDGKTDDTAAITKAFKGSGKDRGKFVVYFPNGTYLVSGVNTSYANPLLHATLSFAGRKGPTVVVGESRERTIIKLRDRDPAFQPDAKAHPVLTVGRAGPSDFGHGVANITIDVGEGNPRAKGLQFHTSNHGFVTSVRIRSSDPGGLGSVGLELRSHNPGPGLLRDVEVVGFDVGVAMASLGFNMVFEHLSLKDQRECGVLSNKLPFALRGLKSVGRVPVVRLEEPHNYACIVGAELLGRDVPEGVAAIESPAGAALFVRDADVKGFATAVRSRVGRTTRYVPAGRIAEFTSHPVAAAAPHSPRTSMRLPIEESPELPWPKPEEWVSVTKFGAVSGDKKDDSGALQKAIDSGAVDIYFPTGEYDLRKTVHVRGKVRRIHGMDSRWAPGVPEGKAVFRIEDGESPVVVIERWKPPPGRGGSGTFVDHASTRAVALRYGSFHGYRNSVPGGKVFIDDSSGGGHVFVGQKVWMRQYNPEARGKGPANVLNRSGDLWVLGIKTEGERTAIETTDGGRTELLGTNLYPNRGVHGYPAFVCEDSEVSLSYSMDNGWTHPDDGYEEHLRVVEGGKTLSAWRSDLYKRGGFADRRGGAFVPLLVHRKRTQAAAPRPTARMGPAGHTRGGLARTAHYAGSAVRGAPERLWSVSTARDNGPMVVVGGTCFFGDRAGGFWAVDAKSGKIRWHIDQAEYVGDRGPGPAVANGIVYFGSHMAMNARGTETGQLLWRFRTDGGTWFAPAVVGDLIIFTSAEGVIYGVDAQTGTERWWLRTPTPIASVPAVADGIGYVGLRGGVIAFEVATGKQLWLFPTGAGVTFPTVSDGVLYVAAEKLWALDAKTGKTLWKQDYFPEQTVRIAVADGEIYFGGPRVHAICVLDSKTGKQKGQPINFNDHGKYNRPTAMTAGPAVADGVLYYVQYATWKTVAVDLKTRTKLWESEAGGGLSSEPCLADGVLYVGQFGAVSAYR